ncbi:hypothetical protein LBMAG49_15530 [Planctomycetota bacterium]|nr:hypothetical protein LBMAG49_15530 [Planctomycetota bacterium]
MSLTSRFLLTLLVTCVLPLLAFGWFTLGGVRRLIETQVVETFLPRLAADHTQKIEGRLQQIYQSCSVVREIARRALDSTEDLDAFAEQVQLVPDLLANSLDLLLLADPDGKVLFWCEGHRLDPAIHGQRAASMPALVRGQDWFIRAQQGGTFYLPWGRSPLLTMSPELSSQDPAQHYLGLVLDVPARNGKNGVLLSLIRWSEVQQLLDETRRVLVQESHFPSAEAFLIDAGGMVQAHTDRSLYGELLRPEALRLALLARTSGNAEFVASDGRGSLCGFCRFGQESNRTWTLGLNIPEDELFLATNTFLRLLFIAIAVTLLVLAAWSLLASRAIVRPVNDLVAATDRVAAGDLEVRVPASGGAELGRLAASFNHMAEDLAQGRARLAIAEREKAWAEMARQIAHEIKNPLTPMRMAAQLLMRARREGDVRADAIADRLARTVEEQTQVLDGIASDFRQFAGAPNRTVERVVLDEFLADVRSASAALFEAGQLKLEFSPSATVACVAVDRRELQRVFLNLLQNASQAASGKVQVRIATTVVGARAEIRVTDDGPGISAAAQERLFEPYFTTKTSGTGLGLAICRRILEQCGGAIRLESTAASGTVFCIELPVLSLA